MGGWGDLRRQQVAAMWKAGMSMGEIARDLNATRSKIAGVLYRMGLMGDRNHASAARFRRMQGIKIVKIYRKVIKPKPRPKPFPTPPAPMETTMMQLPSRRLTLFELPERCCHFITDDPGLYCGVPCQPEQQYCDYHRVVMVRGSHHANDDLQDGGRQKGAVGDDSQQNRSGNRRPDPLGMDARG